MGESSTDDVVEVLSVGEDRLKTYHATYYSFLIPYTGAAGAIVWTVVTAERSSPFLSVAAGLFIVGLSLFYCLWLHSSYKRMAKLLNDAKETWDKLMPNAQSNPYSVDTPNPERVFLWFVIVMGTSGAAVCALNGLL